jgi:taurine dioxygenase
MSHRRGRDLPDPLRAFADTLRAVHTNDYDYAVPPESLSEADQERRRIFLSARYETAHPVVRVHPLTGERGLFIGDFAQRIVGLAKGESYELLKILQHYVARPENILRVTWEPGRLVLFDNRITQHYAVDKYDDAPRPRHRGRRHPGRHRRQPQLFRQGRRLPLLPGRRHPDRGVTSGCARR